MKRATELDKVDKSHSLDEQAYAHIKQAIISGVFQPGEFLAEVRLAEELGISKTPIRTAMARLQEEDFLVYVPYRGYFVADISLEDSREIYQLRQILECHLIQETAHQFSKFELDEMEANIGAAEEAFNRQDYVAYVARNREFHHAFPRKYANRRILKLLTNLDEHVQRILLYNLKNEQSEMLSPREHRMILEAIRTGDVDSAVSLMQDHLEGFNRLHDARR